MVPCYLFLFVYALLQEEFKGIIYYPGEPVEVVKQLGMSSYSLDIKSAKKS